jgi:hypothetical protein
VSRRLKSNEPAKRTIEQISRAKRIRWPGGVDTCKLYRISKRYPKKAFRKALVEAITPAKDGERIKVRIIGGKHDGEFLLIEPYYLKLGKGWRK